MNGVFRFLRRAPAPASDSPPGLCDTAKVDWRSRTDEDLLREWGAGDRAAGGELVIRHFAAVERFFAYKARDAMDDLVQRVFLLCAESAASFRGQGSVRAFIFGIARNVLCEHIRGRQRDGAVPIDFSARSIVDLVPGVATLVGQREGQRLLVLALQKLPLDLQLLLELYYWEELGMDELAAALAIPPGTVKSRLHRARALLKEAIDALPAEGAQRESGQALLAGWLARDKSPSSE